MTCLGLPVPKRLKEMTKGPRIVMMSDNDKKAEQLIRDFCNDRSVSDSQIEHMCKLASGPSGIVIIVNTNGATKSAGDFTAIVSQSPVLQRVDELISFATEYTLSIADVSILDVSGFSQSEEPAEGKNLEWHALLRDILMLKKPKVVLTCWSSLGSVNAPLSRFAFAGYFRYYWIGRDKLAMVSFSDPQHIIKRDEDSVHVNPRMRYLIMWYFVAAINLLIEPVEMDAWMANNGFYGRMLSSGCTPEYAPKRFASLLHQMQGKPLANLKSVKTKDDAEYDQSLLNEISERLQRLRESTQSYKICDVATLALLWDSFFKSHPQYEETAAFYRMYITHTPASDPIAYST